MWIFTDQGYISMVVDKRDSTMLQVRARVPEDITRNFPGAVVYTIDGADYRYRSRIKRSEVAIALAEQVMNMDYIGHFKDVALRKSTPSAGRHDAYYAVWTAMGKLQDYAPYSKLSRVEAAKRPAYSYKDNHDYHGGYYSPNNIYSGGRNGVPFSGGTSGTLDNWRLRDEADDFWTGKDIEPDVPDLDPEVEEAIEEAERLYGKDALDRMGEDEFEEMIEGLVKDNRREQREKNRAFKAVEHRRAYGGPVELPLNEERPRQSRSRRRRRNRRRGGKRR